MAKVQVSPAWFKTAKIPRKCVTVKGGYTLVMYLPDIPSQIQAGRNTQYTSQTWWL